MTSNRATFDAIRSIAMADITSSYKTLGTPFGFPMRILHFVNNTNGDMMISFDGTTDQVFVAANTYVLYDITSDQDSVESMRISANTQVYIKYISAPTEPTDGAFYLACMYGLGE